MKIKDRVIVINDGNVYTTYEEWVRKNAPNLYDEWHSGSHYGDFRGNNTQGLTGTVIAVAEHKWGDELCFVRADDKSLFLIGSAGLEKSKRHGLKAFSNKDERR